LRLKAFTVATPDPESLKKAKGASAEQDGEGDVLSHKTASIEGFSLFCDWE